MALKNWNDLYKVDVSNYTEERTDNRGNSFEYLPWASCVRLLHENGAEKVWFEPIPSADGSSLHMTNQVFMSKKGDSTNRCYEVAVRVTIDDDVFEGRYPVISGSFNVDDANMTQLRVNNAILRCATKLVAIRTGLGFSLWEGDNDETSAKNEVDVVSMQDAKALFTKFGYAISQKERDGYTQEEIAEQLNIEGDLAEVLKFKCLELAGYQKKLYSLKPKEA